MMPKENLAKRQNGQHKRYTIDQCALYKVGSIKRLCKILDISKENLEELLNKGKLYKEFTLPEKLDPFSGRTIKERKVQEPIERLRKIHERILKLLKPIDFPEYAHAAIRGRSYRSNALVHTQARSVATFDLAGFYPSTKKHLVYDFFRYQLKCAADVSGVLSKITTVHSCIPTGSPLSPLLSLHSARPMFDELYNIARKKNLNFSCYVDDLTFSGVSLPSNLEKLVIDICKKHGYDLASEKTKIFRNYRAARITGVILLNGRIRVPYARFSKARKIHKAIKTGINNYNFTKLELHRKLAGLLGEASYLDERYKPWSTAQQRALNNYRYRCTVN